MRLGANIKRLLSLIAGGVLVFLGVILTISPFPMGFLLVAVGLGLLIMHSPKIAAWVRFNRTYNDTINEQATLATKLAPEKIAEALEKTDPRRTYE